MSITCKRAAEVLNMAVSFNGCGRCTRDELYDAVNAATIALREKSEREWISVKDRLPELIPCNAGTAYSEAVNVLTSGRKVLTAIWDGSDFFCDADYWDALGEEITHWTPVLLPLPEQPKEVQT